MSWTASLSFSTVSSEHNKARAMLLRDIKLCKHGVFVMLAFVALTCLLCCLAALAYRHGSESGFEPAPVAVVDLDGSDYSAAFIRMIGAQEFASPLRLLKTSEEKALAGLESGRYTAAVILPEGYARAVLGGKNVTAKLILSDGAALQGDIVTLLADFGEELCAAGQFGVFAGERLVRVKAPDRLDKFSEYCNADYLSEAMFNDWFAQYELSYCGTGTTAEQWYGIVYAVLFLWMSVLTFRALRRDCSPSMLRTLKASGIRHSFYLSKIFIIFVFFALLCGVLCAVLGISVSVSAVLQLCAALITLACVGTALILCLPEGGVFAAVTALGAAGLLCCGGIVPRMQLPDAVLLLGDLLPTGAAARLFSGVFGGLHTQSLIVCALWTLAAVCIIILRTGILIARGGDDGD